MIDGEGGGAGFAHHAAQDLCEEEGVVDVFTARFEPDALLAQVIAGFEGRLFHEFFVFAGGLDAAAEFVVGHFHQIEAEALASQLRSAATARAPAGCAAEAEHAPALRVLQPAERAQAPGDIGGLIHDDVHGVRAGLAPLIDGLAQEARVDDLVPLVDGAGAVADKDH